MGFYIGVMSGTSLDAIDVALIETSPTEPSKLIAHHSTAFSVELQKALKDLINSQRCQLSQLGALDIELGHAYADAILSLLTSSATTTIHQIDAIGCHGQTVLHSPDSNYPFSMQIGNGNVIAEKTGITTICDFRQKDIVNGGQGAPLAPAFHAAMFRSDNENRVIVNIGGISNISILPADSGSPLQGFDTGPGNTLMDSWIQKHQGLLFDNEGKWAEGGEINQTLLMQLKSDPYFDRQIPKSTGCELFNQNWLKQQLIMAKCEDVNAQDIQATLLAFTVSTITDAIHQYARQTDKVYVCGGGARNTALMQQLQIALDNIEVTTTAAIGLDPQWVEAVAFAWLAEQTIHQNALDLRYVTGAQSPSILGAVYWSKKAS
ncbi:MULTISPECIES: anhydro-N-acetylmuramic acid kinase [unclassified Methylophaga]|jgi:anhydro-N-acetylmuramic acid kinase|uniref:anhydro-N-acetylmuramic acid kinase n=2 Tax=unclassified Methylophaga TaxID=2629249 RepID=UPI000C8CC145|nr:MULTISPECIES: anhydro-N-acetylmuramic acid kinase [unclassified Methylophaga]MAK68181.1 anhydro-N-acetylmuramic acid kinase [Methylophaga sp.]MAY16646.1 anhydro-N-acetylmuramic acid kinase [Methylophaga sp.]MBN46257.1 anhydro-N-acetylmuramic acid kinase [Methylophaga sp.]HCD04720.1 anhydro-N-acetylmuramic acid kinase [Methylophaga sp.]|tara:strand:+ start:4918 stop:6048 length:1131 start_codon:yes stop_codon:yes gene_type:complete